MDATELNHIRKFVAGLLEEHDDRAPFTDTDSLVGSGRLDSLSVVKLVTFLESDFAVDFSEVKFDPQRLDSVAGIAAVVDEFRAQR